MMLYFIMSTLATQEDNEVGIGVDILNYGTKSEKDLNWFQTAQCRSLLWYY
jgi:hypothetical protein